MANAQVHIIAYVGQYKLWGFVPPIQKCSLVPTEHIFTRFPNYKWCVIPYGP